MVMDESAPVLALLAGIDELNATLRADVAAAKERLSRTGNQFDRRVLVRATFTFVEGTVAGIKRNALSWEAYRPGLFNEGDRMLLKEVGYKLDERGHVVRQHRFLRLADNVLFAFRMFGHVMDIDFKPDTKSPRWKAFQDAVRIRNRVTHPATAEACVVSDQDLATLNDGYDWFATTYARVVTLVADAVFQSARDESKPTAGEDDA